MINFSSCTKLRVRVWVEPWSRAEASGAGIIQPFPASATSCVRSRASWIIHVREARHYAWAALSLSLSLSFSLFPCIFFEFHVSEILPFRGLQFNCYVQTLSPSLSPQTKIIKIRYFGYFTPRVSSGEPCVFMVITTLHPIFFSLRLIVLRKVYAGINQSILRWARANKAAEQTFKKFKLTAIERAW